MRSHWQAYPKVRWYPLPLLYLSLQSFVIVLCFLICSATTHRYKLSIIAGDDTGDTDFIMFGKWVQRLTKQTADTLIAENPRGFIPNEITRLLEKVFKWNVSFTQNTISSNKVCFQVNAVVGEINDTETLLPMTPSGSQSSSLMISQGAGSSMQRTPQKSVAIPLPSQPTVSHTSHASSTTPTKAGLSIPEPQVTPQSRIHTNEDQVSISNSFCEIKCKPTTILSSLSLLQTLIYCWRLLQGRKK